MNTLNGNSNGNADFKMKTAEFRGYTLKALEDISKEIIECKEAIKENTTRIESLGQRLSALQSKVAGIGAAAGVVTSMVIHYLLI